MFDRVLNLILPFMSINDMIVMCHPSSFEYVVLITFVRKILIFYLFLFSFLSHYDCWSKRPNGIFCLVRIVFGPKSISFSVEFWIGLHMKLKRICMTNEKLKDQDIGPKWVG